MQKPLPFFLKTNDTLHMQLAAHKSPLVHLSKKQSSGSYSSIAYTETYSLWKKRHYPILRLISCMHKIQWVIQNLPQSEQNRVFVVGCFEWFFLCNCSLSRNTCAVTRMHGLSCIPLLPPGSNNSGVRSYGNSLWMGTSA